MSARTSDSHCQVALSLALVLRQRELEILESNLEKTLRRRIFQDVVPHCRNEARAGAQAFDVKRIGKESNVPDQIRVRGQAVFESEGNELDTKPLRPFRISEESFHRSPEFVTVVGARIDDAIRPTTKPGEFFALARNSGSDVPLVRQRVWPSRLTEAAHQRSVIGVEENDLHPVALPTDVFEGPRQLIEELSGSGIHSARQFVARMDRNIRRSGGQGKK